MSVHYQLQNILYISEVRLSGKLFNKKAMLVWNFQDAIKSKYKLELEQIVLYEEKFFSIIKVQKSLNFEIFSSY